MRALTSLASRLARLSSYCVAQTGNCACGGKAWAPAMLAANTKATVTAMLL
jgi:hypothetical protein